MKPCSKFLLAVAFVSFLFCNSVFSQQHYEISLKDGETYTSSNLNKPKRDVKLVDNSYYTVNYSFDFLSVNTKTIEQELYQLVNHEGFGSLKNIGAPSVPARLDYIAIPDNLDIKVEIIDAQFIEVDNINLHPELEPARDTEGAPEPVFKMDEKIYSTNEYYPQSMVKLVDIQKSRGVSLAMVQCVPVQYNPVTKKLRVYKSLTYKLSGNAKLNNPLGLNNTEKSNDFLKNIILNPDVVSAGASKGQYLKSDNKNYIIVTHSEYLNAARKLANWKQQLGYGVDIVSSSSWTAAEIKTEIHTRYANWTPKPEYFVIIGDHNGDFAVPGEVHQCPDNEDFATDLYYACMDGAGDYFPDMAHGRISANSLAEANVVVDKIINYEKNPVENSSYYANALNCAQYQDDDNDGYADRRFCHTSEDVRDYLTSEHGYTVDRIYYTNTSANVENLRYNSGYYSNGQLLPDEIRNTSFNWNGGASDITSAVDQGKFCILHRDHGYSGASGWSHPYYTISTMDNLSNGDLLPIIFSINCHTGEFQLNSFAEKFMRMENKGAVGVVGAAYYSYSGYNDAIVSGMFDAIWPEPGLTFDFGYGGVNNPPPSGPPPAFRTMGDVVNYGLIRMVETWNGGYSANRYQHELFHYFGDPAMKIWTSNPYDSVIAADYATGIDCAGNSFSVSNCNADGAFVTIVQNNEIVGSGVISGANTDISYSLITNGEAIITISKENHKSLIDTIQTIGTCTYAPMVVTSGADNISYDLADLHGEIVSDNGAAVTSSGFVVGTSPNPEIGDAGVSVYNSDPLVTYGNISVQAIGLDGSTRYYFRAFATNAEGTSYGLSESFSTICSPVSNYPFTYDFEGDFADDCWQIEYVAGENLDWVKASGNGSNINSAYSGQWNILLKDTDLDEDITKLISPLIDLGNTQNALLSFYHNQAEFFGYNDELRIYYKNETSTEWVLLAEYTEPLNSWQRQLLLLPDLSSNYQIAFEGKAINGKGVAVDYAQIYVSDESANISTSVTSLADFGEIETGSFSLPQSYTISASGLLCEYIIEAPEGFVLCDSENGEYTSSIMIDHNNGSINNAEVFVKFAPVEPVNYSNAVVNYSPGAEEIEISVNGSGIPGLVGNAAKKSLKISPNPAKESISVDYSSNNYDIQIVNLTGSVVKRINNANGSINISLSDINPGVYFLKLTDKKNTAIQKFVKE